MALGGLALPRRAAAGSGPRQRSSHKAIINVYLPGGPPHIDMWDLKPDAPAEIRGEFNPIKTNVPGMEICELFPKLASDGRQVRDHPLAGRQRRRPRGLSVHDRPQEAASSRRRAAGRRWAPGSSKLKGNVNPAVPAHVSLMYKTGERAWGDPGDGGFLGMGHAPFRLVGGKDNGPEDRQHGPARRHARPPRRPRLAAGQPRPLPPRGRRQRRDGRASTRSPRRRWAFSRRRKLADALDLSKEDPKVVEKYGVDDPAFERDGAPRMVRNFCIARRLVEAGARVRLDELQPLGLARRRRHELRQLASAISRCSIRGLSSLLTDLHERGLDKDVSVVVWGEFGRTPRLNNKQQPRPLAAGQLPRSSPAAA